MSDIERAGQRIRSAAHWGEVLPVYDYHGQHPLFSTPEQRVYAVRSFVMDRKDLWAANSEIRIQIHYYFSLQLHESNVGMDSFSAPDHDSQGRAQYGTRYMACYCGCSWRMLPS